MQTISRWSDIPDFDDAVAESRFWEAHQLDGQLMASSAQEVDPRDSTMVTLRFDPRMLLRIKRLARSRFLNYQPMMKQWLAERIEEEMRKP